MKTLFCILLINRLEHLVFLKEYHTSSSCTAVNCLDDWRNVNMTFILHVLLSVLVQPHGVLILMCAISPLWETSALGNRRGEATVLLFTNTGLTSSECLKQGRLHIWQLHLCISPWHVTDYVCPGSVAITWGWLNNTKCLVNWNSCTLETEAWNTMKYTSDDFSIYSLDRQNCIRIVNCRLLRVSIE